MRSDSFQNKLQQNKAEVILISDIVAFESDLNLGFSEVILGSVTCCDGPGDSARFANLAEINVKDSAV